tara:strand:+ start:5853 stop:6224 length:372 start_codon:yes stop_codon:yes gene_type:complete
MAEITLYFPETEQSSVQVGDTAYYINPDDDSGGFQVANQDNLVLIGTIIEIQPSPPNSTFVIKCNIDDSTPLPTSSSFILFSKNNSVNCSSLLGYYGSAKFKNNSTEKAEMFATSCEVNESSK